MCAGRTRKTLEKYLSRCLTSSGHSIGYRREVDRKSRRQTKSPLRKSIGCQICKSSTLVSITIAVELVFGTGKLLDQLFYSPCIAFGCLDIGRRAFAGHADSWTGLFGNDGISV